MNDPDIQKFFQRLKFFITITLYTYSYVYSIGEIETEITRFIIKKVVTTTCIINEFLPNGVF